MTKSVIVLEGREVLPSGEVVVDPYCAAQLLMGGMDPSDLLAHDHAEIQMFNKRNLSTKGIRVLDDAPHDEPDPATRHWVIPPEYLELDVLQMCLDEIERRNLPENYTDRLIREFEFIDQHGMIDFFRAMCWVAAQFEQHDILWGVGRGSSCASLVLFLIGINLIDPVLHDIPAREFYKGINMSE